MKKLNRLIFLNFLFSVVALCLLNTDICAISFRDLNTGKLSKISESKTVEDIGDGIIKEGTISTKYKEYKFDSGIVLDDKYISVEIFDIYKRKESGIDVKNKDSNSVLAVSTFSVNFRHNDKLGTADCLSVSRGSLSNDKNTKITGFSRRINQKKDCGAGIIKTTLTNGNDTFQKKYIIKCDSAGNISIS